MTKMLKQYYFENAKLMFCSSVELNEKNSLKLKGYIDKAMALRINLEKAGVKIQDFSNYSNEYIAFENAELKSVDEARLESWLWLKSQEKQDSQEVIFLSAILKVKKMLK